MKKIVAILVVICALMTMTLAACSSKASAPATTPVHTKAPATPAPTPTPTPAPTEAPAPAPTEAPAPVATPVPQLKDTIDPALLKDCVAPKDASWLKEAKNATVFYSANAGSSATVYVYNSCEGNPIQLFTVRHGDKIKLLARENNWDFISTEDNKYGWIYSQYVLVDGQTEPDIGYTASGEAEQKTDPETPVKPTNPPVTPTNPPVTPTDPPVTPTDPPVTPTDPPVTPTDPPVTPTDPPVTPTDPPVTPVDPGSDIETPEL